MCSKNLAFAAVVDPEKYMSGGKSTDWGHSLSKFVKSKEISFKYVQRL
jgi:hypothetical protein